MNYFISIILLSSNLFLFSQEINLNCNRIAFMNLDRINREKLKFNLKEINRDSLSILGLKFKNFDFNNEAIYHLKITNEIEVFKNLKRTYNLIILEKENINSKVFVDEISVSQMEEMEVTSFNDEFSVSLEFNKTKEKLMTTLYFKRLKEDTSYYYIMEPTIQNKIKIFDYKDSKDNFTLGIYDFNNDNLFNSNDIIFVGLYGQKYFTFYSEGFINSNKITSDITVESNSNFYVIDKIDSLGKSITIQKTTGKKKINIKKLDEIPDLTYKTIDNKEINFKDLLNDSTYVFIDIWSIFCKPCYRSFPELNELAKKYEDKLKIVSLLDRGTKEDLLRVVKQYELNFDQGFSSDQINSELLLNGYPTCVLFDPNGKIVSSVSSTSDLLLFISKIF
jgi:thiol-disulfide isomerase/thioredoxin